MSDQRAVPDEGAEPAQGYCGLCRVLYRDLEQHLSSLLHLDAVGVARRGAEPSSRSSSQPARSLLERFLHDVQEHHPHRYSRPDSTATPPPGPTAEATPPPAEATPPQVTWSSWQRNRREKQREDFSSDHCSSTIEEVIQRYCYNRDEDQRSDSLHFSLPVSMETQTEWDVDLQETDVSDVPPVPPLTLVPSSVETLLQLKVDVEQDYSEQLQWLLDHPEERRSPWRGNRGFLDRPIESVLPAPQFFPASFRGKSWTQIEREDEARVHKLVQQFKSGVRTCYFDTESLCRFGCRGYGTKTTPDVLPLMEHEEEEEEPRKRKRRSFRLASRCQVVKLSRSTQTLLVSSPTVATALDSSLAPPPEQTPPPGRVSALPPLPEPSERYASLLTPLQPQTSVLFLLGHTPLPSPRRRQRRGGGPACRWKVTYRRLPLTPLSVRESEKPLKHRHRCVRQLFRNLSPELNTGPAPNPEQPTPPRREGLRSCRPRPLP